MSETSITHTGGWRETLKHLGASLPRAVPFASGIIVALIAIYLFNVLAPPPHQLTSREVNDVVAQALASATPPPAISVLVYQEIRPSLVLIITQAPDENGRPGAGLGTGIVIDDNGDVLTCLHVVANATDIQLTFADGTQSSGQVTASQPENDIAVVSASQLPSIIIPATLGNPHAMQVGDEAYAVGNPLGLYASMSAGVISGFNRSFQIPETDQKLEGLIQFDAAVNPGNSGGPLLNRYGQVIGIVEGILNPSEQDAFAGIGFAVPINIAGGAAGLPPY